MDAMTFGGGRAPATTVPKYRRGNSRERFFTRFLNALRESRLNEARRVIEMHATRNNDSCARASATKDERCAWRRP